MQSKFTKIVMYISIRLIITQFNEHKSKYSYMRNKKVEKSNNHFDAIQDYRPKDQKSIFIGKVILKVHNKYCSS